MFRSRFLTAATVAAAALFAVPSVGRAAFTLKFDESSVTQKVITDGTTGTNPDGLLDGNIVHFGTYGSFNTGVTVAGSNAMSGSTPAKLGITSLFLVNTAATTKTITFTLEDDGYTAPSGLKWLITSLSSSAFSSGGKATAQVYIDGTPGTVVKLNSSAAADGPAPSGGGFSSEMDGAFTTGNPYTMKLVVSITLDGGGTFSGSGNAEVHPVPAPAGVVLLASALPFAVGLRRRFRKADPATAA